MPPYKLTLKRRHSPECRSPPLSLATSIATTRLEGLGGGALVGRRDLKNDHTKVIDSLTHSPLTSPDSFPSSLISRSTLHGMELSLPNDHIMLGSGSQASPSRSSDVSRSSSFDCDSDDNVSEITDYSQDWSVSLRQRRIGVQAWVLRVFGNEVYRRVTQDIEPIVLAYSGSISCAGPGSPETANGSAAAISGASSRGLYLYGSNKRLRANDPQKDPDEDRDEGSEKRRKMTARPLNKLLAGMRYACPYFKHNPSKHLTWRSCAGPGWENVHRAKYVHVVASIETFSN
jgi:hypothetical protein